MELLLTGASGFLGRNICSILQDRYAIKTVGLTPLNYYVANLATEIPKFSEKIDIVFHAAGKAHSMPKTEMEKQLFFDVNFQDL